MVDGRAVPELHDTPSFVVVNVDVPPLVCATATHVPLDGQETAVISYKLAGIDPAVHVVPPSVVSATAFPTATHSVADTHETAASWPPSPAGTAWVLHVEPPSVDARIPVSRVIELPPANPVPTAKQSEAVGQLTLWRSTLFPSPLGTVAADHVLPPSALTAICPPATVTHLVADGHDTARGWAGSLSCWLHPARAVAPAGTGEAAITPIDPNTAPTIATAAPRERNHRVMRFSSTGTHGRAAVRHGGAVRPSLPVPPALLAW